jgi:hypothetical protein
MALNTILSHPDQDSYVTIAEANDYLAIKQNYSHWAGLTTTQKEGFLKQAALQMDQLRYKGYEVYHTDKDYRREQNRLSKLTAQYVALPISLLDYLIPL